MIIDGKAIAADILESVSKEVIELGRTPVLTAITCAPNFETQKYLEMKKRRAAAVGINLNVVELPVTATNEDVLACIGQVAVESDGIVVQLPLPKHIDTDQVLAAVPVNKDPDAFHYGENNDHLLPPVVGAIDEISKRHNLDWKNKKVTVVGAGRLVGLPAIYYAKKAGAEVTTLNRQNFDIKSIEAADIIISGIGQPQFIKADSIKSGAVVFDAGTSEEGGILVGDVDSAAIDKASLITPVPGGIGPITIACLLRNLVILASQ